MPRGLFEGITGKWFGSLDGKLGCPNGTRPSKEGVPLGAAEETRPGLL